MLFTTHQLLADGNSWNKIRYDGGTVAAKVNPYDWNTTLTVTPDRINLVFAHRTTLKLTPAQVSALSYGEEAGSFRNSASKQEPFSSASSSALEQRLDPARYFRISRASLINLSAVTEVHPLPGGSGEVVLRNGQKLEVSRRRLRDLLQALGGSG